MSERKQEHAGFAVEWKGDRIRIEARGLVEFQSTDDEAVIYLGAVDDAQALRDALSAFLAFHKPG